ncbi:MAG TPA: cupin domain-containing protein [Gaiellaceae bacterium]
MRRLSFGPAAARTVADDRLEHVTIAPLTEPLARGAAVQAACFRVEAGGRIARHLAAVDQILAVVEGTGWVSGDDGREERIAAGEAVFWRRGESHETRTETGLTAIVIEAESLAPLAGPS